MHKAAAFFFVCAGALGPALLLPRPAAGAWSSDSSVNVPVSIPAGDQRGPTITSDGAGGAIVTWRDDRSGNSDIYAQRISAAGTVLWAADGVVLCDAAGAQQYPAIILDGAGGAIVVWSDSRSGNADIYAQRISADGTVQWAANGVPLCTAVGDQSYLTIIPASPSGATVAWQDWRNGNSDIYAQRISAAGTPQWTADGVALCSAVEEQSAPSIVSVGPGGVIVAWQDWRNGYWDIYVQRLSADGAPQWEPDGMAVCYAFGSRHAPTIAWDAADGAIVAWEEVRNGGFGDIYAQRISADGWPVWPPDGVALCSATGAQQRPVIVSDFGGYAIVAWEDRRAGNWDIYAQQIWSDGTVQWTANGVALCRAMGDQSYPTIAPVPDELCGLGAAGAVVTWQDRRSGIWDIYAQRVSPSGSVDWTPNGVALCTAAGDQYAPRLTSDIGSRSGNDAIVTWEDGRNGDYDIYAQNINHDGALGLLVPIPVLLSFVSVDVAADGTTLTWFAGGSMNAAATVYRSTVSDPWTRIGEVAADGTGYLRYTDRDDATATRVGYRLGIVEAGVEGFYGEAWVDLPALEAARCEVRPNPSRGGALTVRFTLPGGTAASLELLDVAGRRIARREVGSLGAGQHSLDLGEGRRLAPGLYLVCLRQGTNVRMTRVAVLE